MKLTLIRNKPIGNGTPGSLYIDGKFECFTLEDLERDIKIPGLTAIPKGSYVVQITMSQRFKKLMPLLLNVPGFEGVRIHSGNNSGDTEGCILVGSAASVLYGNPLVTNSRDAFNKLFSKLQAEKGKIVLEIK